MERTQVQIPAAQLDLQRDFEAKLKEMHADRPLRALVDTFGCQQNVADSQYIMGMLRAMGCSFTDDPAQADVVVLNTCAIRDHAEKRVYGNLGALTHTKKANPAQVICLCGCMAQRPEVAEKVRQSYRHVDLVFGPQALWKFPELLYQVYTQRRRVFSVADEHGSIAEGMPVVREGRTRAWVSIMYGCNNFCSYCIVPYVRGRERSRRADDILREAEGLLQSGVKEIMLLGQNVNSYGAGTGDSFPGLLRRLDALGVERIRFMTSHPKDLSDDLIDAMAQCKHVCNHLHLPVQSGNDDILRLMNRRYTREDYLRKVEKLRAAVPGIGLTTDLIVSFPGETEKQFEDTCSLVREVGYDAAFTFIYSPREGTRAAAMEGRIPEAESTRRIEQLIREVEASTARVHQSMIGRHENVLVESLSKRDDRKVSGKGTRGITVTLDGTEADIGTIIPVTITSAAVNTLRGERTER